MRKITYLLSLLCTFIFSATATAQSDNATIASVTRTSDIVEGKLYVMEQVRGGTSYLYENDQHELFRKASGQTASTLVMKKFNDNKTALVRFIKDAGAETYQIQLATDYYFKQVQHNTYLTTTADASEAGHYYINKADKSGATCFQFGTTSTGGVLLDNNAAGNTVSGWNNTFKTSVDDSDNNAWNLYEVTYAERVTVTYQYKENDEVVWSQEVPGLFNQENPAPTFYNNFVTFDYPTQTLTGDITIQLTNPTYNFPFAYGATVESAPLVALDTHGNEANYPIYSSEGNIRVEFTAKVNADEYRGGAVKSMDYAWKIVGNPFNGFKVYNVETGKYMVQPNDDDVEILLGDEGTVFQVYNPNLAGNPIDNEDFDASIGFCLKQVDRNNYINHRTTKLQGWTSPDGGSTFRAYTINATDVSYDLTFKAQYATVCLPFYSEVPAGLTLYSNTQVDDNNVLTLVPAGTLLKANTPYIVEADATGTYTFTNTSANTATESVTVGNLTGVLAESGETVENGKYILALNKQTNQQAFYLTDGTVVCPKNKCYFTAPESLASVSAFFLGHNGESTGIEDVFNGKNGETVIYNTAGQRINKLQKGINIVNGHKVLVK